MIKPFVLALVLIAGCAALELSAKPKPQAGYGLNGNCRFLTSPDGLVSDPCFSVFTLPDTCVYFSNRGDLAVVKKEPGMRCE